MAPEIYQYARLTMNKRPWNSPDAWVARRVNYDSFFGSNPPVRRAGSGVQYIADVSHRAGNLVVSVKRPAVVTLYDLTGRKIAGGVLVEKSIVIPRTSFGSGTSVLVVQSAGETYRRKICM